MRFSVIIPVKGLNDYIAESVPILLGIDHKDFEIIILPNDKPAKIPAYLTDKKVRIIPTGKVSPAIKRDIGARHSRGEFLAFIDDDAYPRADWLNVAEEIFRDKKAAAICGPAVTPFDDSVSQKASGLFFETYSGGGGYAYRYRPAKKSFYVDDYPSVNLIVSKQAFLDVGGFDNDYWPGEDTKFCLDLKKKRHRIWYSNELVVYHHRRKLFVPHLKQVGNYGKHRGYFAKKFPETSLKPAYFAPSLFLAGNILLFVMSFVSTAFFSLWLILLGVYFLIVSIDVFSRTRNISIALLAIVTAFLTHITYGFMFLRGLSSRKFRSELR
jgi:GT2 family glycosyltransferase